MDEETQVQSRRDAILAAMESGTDVERVETEEVERPERTRDELGRFSQEAEETPSEAPEEPAETVEEKRQRQYPSSWKKDVEPLYRELEGNEQYQALLDEIERREGDFHKGIESYKTDAQFGQAMKQAVEPFMATIQSQGVDAPFAVQALLSADHRLRYGNAQEKIGAIKQIARDYQIDLSGLTAEQPEVDPVVAPLAQELDSLKRQLQQYHQQQYQSQMASLNSEISAFAQDKPHFEAVREDMAALLEAGRAKDLAEAYEMATWARPDVRTKILAEQKAAEEKSRLEQAKAKAVAAKNAGSSVKGGPVGAGNGAPDPNDRRAVIEAALSRGRV